MEAWDGMTEDSDPRDAEIDRLREENQQLREENQRLKDEVQRLEDKVNELEDLIKRFKTQPSTLAASEATAEAGGVPSSQTFYKKNRNPEENPTGAQPGHEGHARETPTTTHPPVVLDLEHCPDCGHDLGEPADVMTRTVTNIPTPQSVTYELERPRYWCPDCQERKHQDNPLPYQRYGVNLAAWTTHQRLLGLSLGKTQENAQQTWDLDLSDGAILGMTDWVADALGPAYEEIQERIRKAEVVGGDETGFRIDGTNGWMWVADALDATLYTIQDTRGQDVPDALYGDFEGVLVRDGWRAYETVEKAEHQLCWLHVNRWLERAEHANRVEPRPLVDEREVTLDGPGRPPERLLRFVDGVRTIARDAIAWVDENDQASLDERRAAAKRFRAELIEHVEKGWTQDDTQRIAGTLARHLEREEVFTFVRVPGVAWHNNAAERAIRKGVHHRKVSGGRRSWAGAHKLSVLLSVYETCKKQGQEFLSLVRDALVPEGFCNSSLRPGPLPQP